MKENYIKEQWIEIEKIFKDNLYEKLELSLNGMLVYHYYEFINEWKNTGFYWSSSSFSDSNMAFFLFIQKTFINSQNNHNKTNGFSVRCLKN